MNSLELETGNTSRHRYVSQPGYPLALFNWHL
jgi:hypothetical protein